MACRGLELVLGKRGRDGEAEKGEITLGDCENIRAVGRGGGGRRRGFGFVPSAVAGWVQKESG